LVINAGLVHDNKKGYRCKRDTLNKRRGQELSSERQNIKENLKVFHGWRFRLNVHVVQGQSYHNLGVN
jgi:hypothetical protein